MKTPTQSTLQKAFWIAGWTIISLASASTVLGLLYRFYRLYTFSRFPHYPLISLAKHDSAALKNEKPITDDAVGERGGWLSSFLFRGDSFTSGRKDAWGWQMSYRYRHDGLFDSISTDDDDEGIDGV
ncbi:MAG: hypothetical protein L6R37_006765 [Teloschistes peruensis]|nr:MAG: hypothetical protein L6R37_006765 [Teloschistes peruensis]